MTQEQFAQLLQTLQARPQDAAPGVAAGAAAIAGQMPPCNLGRNKVKRFKKWADWLRDAEAKMGFLKITRDADKLDFLRSCAGKELTEFWVKEARIRYESVPDGEAAHTYQEVLKETKTALLKVVSRDRAIIDLLRMDQGNRTFMEFLSEIEDQEFLCQTEDEPLTGDDLKRISLLAGMKDRSLAEKAIAEEYTLDKLIQAGINRESSRANVEAMQTKNTETVSRLASSGKYSTRHKPQSSKSTSKKRCDRCTYKHGDGRCPAEERDCNDCSEIGHFAGSKLCKKQKAKPKRSRHTARRVKEYSSESSETQSETSEEEYDTEVIARIERSWPGVESKANSHKYVYKIEDKPGKKRQSKRVKMKVGGKRMKLYCDTGSPLTIIPPEMYREKMGKVVAADTHFRAWGSKKRLDTKGRVRTTLQTKRGAKKETWVYIVAGTRPEPLLGEEDAEDLGIIQFLPEGRAATPQEKEVGHIETSKASIPERLRRSGRTVATEKPQLTPIENQTKKEAEEIVSSFTDSVMTERIGDVQVKPVELQYEKDFSPVQPARYPVPHHYRERLSNHLGKLRNEGVIEDVNPAEPIDCILNIAISEKKNSQIRMNIDARPINVGAKHTKYHVPTPQEIRHQLEGAKVFTELDMCNGFHQIPLSKESQIIFQSHEGLHKMKRLFFGPKNSSGIFHHEVQKLFAGLPGCITLHDNVLVYGETGEAHNKNLKAVLQRAKDKGVTFKPSQNTICAPEVKWFGRIFSQAGISADPEKIRTIVEAGPPQNTQDIKSLLQAAAYNAKFAYDHSEDETYEEVTAPLRELLKKGVHFSWDERRQKSYLKLVRMMNDKAILTPFVMGRKTHLVTDASPHGISASLYQEDDQGRWLPVDHTSRALSDHEQAWKSQIDWESLAKMWGMTIFRTYLVGQTFTSWGDQKPLIPLYNDFTKQAPIRVTKHRNKVMDLTFTDKYLPGRYMPADYSSRHPEPISNLTKEERETLEIDDGDDIQVMRVIMADLPPALTTKMIQEVAEKDKTYQKLLTAVRKGVKPHDKELGPYTAVWEELAVVENLVLRNERIVIPEGMLSNDEGDIREWIVELGHSGHMGIAATKRLLRLRLWFPGMDKLVERRVSTCLPCQAATENHTRDPLKPTKAPKEAWKKLYVDHWGPFDGNKYILVIIDALTRFPEVMIVKGTSAEQNIHAFSETFARHGRARTIHSDNGAPFNGTDSHLLRRYLNSLGIPILPNRSAEDPEATGLVEAFMKHIKKVIHTATVAGEDLILALHRHLWSYRATPHPTTGKSPAELLYGRKFYTTLPDMRTDPASERKDILEALAEDEVQKEKMKAYKDSSRNVKPHSIKEGDLVLLKRKTTKRDSPYDPDPFLVTSVWGTQIQGERHGKKKTRDAQRWKKLQVDNRPRRRPHQELPHDADVGAGEEDARVLRARRRHEEPHQEADQPAQAEGPPQDEENELLPEPEPTVANTTNIIPELRNHPDVIISETVANRPTHSKIPIRRYEPANWKNKNK